MTNNATEEICNAIKEICEEAVKAVDISGIVAKERGTVYDKWYQLTDEDNEVKEKIKEILKENNRTASQAVSILQKLSEEIETACDKVACDYLDF